MPRSAFAIIEAPSVLGLFPRGVEKLSDALLAAGLAECLQARRAGRVEPPPYNERRDPETLILNPRGIADYSAALADAVGRVADAGEFPIVLGGDCSIMLGCMLALKRRGRYGLLFLDGHADFYQPEAEPNGEAASMDLAFATGRGPESRPTSRAEARWCVTKTSSYSDAVTPRTPRLTAVNASRTRRSG
jgi:arginase